MFRSKQDVFFFLATRFSGFISFSRSTEGVGWKRVNLLDSLIQHHYTLLDKSLEEQYKYEIEYIIMVP